MENIILHSYIEKLENISLNSYIEKMEISY